MEFAAAVFGNNWFARLGLSLSVQTSLPIDLNAFNPSGTRVVHIGELNPGASKNRDSEISVLRQMCNELGIAIGNCASLKTVAKMLWSFVCKDLYETMFVGNLTGLINIAKHPILTLKNLWKQMLKLAREILAVIKSKRIDLIGKMILRSIVSAVLFSYGFSRGKPVPDLDLGLKHKIGAHRSIWTHSMLPILIAEAVKLLVLRVGTTLYESLPKNHHPHWDIIATEGAGAIRIFTSGFQVGVIAHLLQDVFVDGSQNLRDTDGTSLVSKKHLVTKKDNFIYHREITPSDLFMAASAAVPGARMASKWAAA